MSATEKLYTKNCKIYNPETQIEAWLVNLRCFLQVVQDQISIEELKKMSEKMFESLVKAVVDIEQGIMVVDAGMHADEEYFMLENGSLQEHLWGINLHPDKWGNEGFIVFDSIINLRPRQGNRSRSVEDPKIQERIVKIVNRLVAP